MTNKFEIELEIELLEPIHGDKVDALTNIVEGIAYRLTESRDIKSAVITRVSAKE